MNVVNNIPKHWQRKKLGEVCDKVTDGSHFSPKSTSEGYPYVTVRDIKKDSSIDFENCLKISKEDYNNLLKNDCKPLHNDVLFSKDGTVGKVSLINFDRDFVILSSIAILRPNVSIINSKYLFNILKSNGFLNKALDQKKGVAIRRIILRDLKEIEIPLPPLPEQVAIVSKIEELLSDLENGLQQLQTAQQQLKVYRQSLLKAAFEGKLTNKEVKDGELPEGWKKLKLREITTEKDGLRRGPFGSAIKKEFFVKEGYKVYEQGNAINNDPYRGCYFLNEEKFKELNNFKVLPFDLIVSCSGVTLGRICEIPVDAQSGIINQALLRIRLKNNLISNRFFINQFRSAFFQRKIFDQSQGTAMPNLVGIKDFKEIEMNVPSLTKQQNIISELESKLTVCDKIEETISQSLQQAESLRQSILKKAFEGRLVETTNNYRKQMSDFSMAAEQTATYRSK